MKSKTTKSETCATSCCSPKMCAVITFVVGAVVGVLLTLAVGAYYESQYGQTNTLKFIPSIKQNFAPSRTIPGTTGDIRTIPGTTGDIRTIPGTTGD